MMTCSTLCRQRWRAGSAGVVTLTGTARNHADANDVENLTVTFQNVAFTSGDAARVVDSAKKDVQLDFIDLALTYEGTFKEAKANDGSFDNSKPVTITLTGDTLTGEDGEDFVDTDKVQTNIAEAPPGLTAVVTRTSSKEL